MRRSVQPAFTLLELILVITLIGLVAVFAWPDFGAAQASEEIRESARRMTTAVAMCRAEAMNDACRYRIRVRLDGSVRVEQQLDPIVAPHVYVPVRASWGRTEPLLPDVWVEAVQLLPDGPAPIRIIDENIEFPEMELEPVPIDEYEFEPTVYFEPDGSCSSLRWVLRDVRGAARLLTLDGRLGRVDWEDWEAVEPDQVRRPEPVEEEEPEEYDVEDFER